MDAAELSVMFSKAKEGCVQDIHTPFCLLEMETQKSVSWIFKLESYICTG